METKLQSKQQYPRFIQNKPCGIDKFDGGSQERLAKTIARHFCQNDSLDEECTLPRIIPNRSLEIFRAKSYIIAGCSIVIASIY